MLSFHAHTINVTCTASCSVSRDESAAAPAWAAAHEGTHRAEGCLGSNDPNPWMISTAIVSRRFHTRRNGACVTSGAWYDLGISRISVTKIRKAVRVPDQGLSRALAFAETARVAEFPFRKLNKVVRFVSKIRQADCERWGYVFILRHLYLRAQRRGF